MNYVIKRLLGGIFIFMIGTVAFAQIKDLDYKYNPPCNQTLKFSVGDFYEKFEKENKTTLAEVEIDALYVYWAECKHQENIKKLANYPMLKTRLLKLRGFFGDLLTQDASFGSQLAGGGTMYNHLRNRNEAFIEETMAKLVNLTTNKAGAETSTIIKARYQKALAAINLRLAKIKTPSKQDLEYTNSKTWFETVKLYEKALNGIRAIAGPKIDISSTTILEFAAGFSWIDEE